jgi:hypothetical protein
MFTFIKHFINKQLILFVLLVCSLTSCNTEENKPNFNIFCAETIDFSQVAVGGAKYGTTLLGQEMVTCLPTVYQPNYKFFPIYAIEVDLKAGDTLQAFAEFQVTNNTGVNVMIASQIQLTKDLGFRTPGWKAVTQHNGFNVTPAMHYGVMTKIGAIRLTEDFKGYLVLFAWAATNANPNTSLRVDRNYGQLQYIIH